MLLQPEREDLIGRCHPRAVARVATALGPLARWWLKPRALQTIDASPATIEDLPAASGACWLLLANEDTATHGGSLDSDRGLLRPACLLPCRWIRGPHAPNLPPPLRTVADAVRHDLACVASIGSDEFGLQLADDTDGRHVHPDALGLTEVGSGWASLAAGLWSLATRSGSNQRIWATGCWRGPDNALGAGIEPVARHTLHQKVQLAQIYGADQLFLPETQLLDARQNLPPGVAAQRFFGRLRIDEPQPLQALGSYLAALKNEPPPGAELPELRQHYLHLVKLVGSFAARNFRQRRVEPLVAQRVAERFAPTVAALGAGRPRQLVTIVSESPELPALTIQAVQAETCLLLYTSDQSGRDTQPGNLQKALERIAALKLGCQVVTEEFHNDQNMDGDLQSAVSRLRLQLRPDEGLIFDLTPGSKLMSYALAFAVAQPQDWMIYLRHVWLPEAKVQDPGTEELVLWRAREPWTQLRAHAIQDA